MALKARTLVGLDVHAAQTHAAVVDPATGEVRVVKLRMPPDEVVGFLAGLGSDVVAVYEAGPTGFGLARAARVLGVDVRVVAPGSIPKGSGDRVKTDRRDAIRLVRLLAAGELTFAFVPTIEDEHFRDLLRTIEDVRGDLMCGRRGPGSGSSCCAAASAIPVRAVRGPSSIWHGCGRCTSRTPARRRRSP